MSGHASKCLRAALLVGAVSASVCSATAAPTAAEKSVANFYRGRTINLVIGYSPGGSYDTYARLLARFMGPHIPGAPQIVPVNMPGASSRVAAAYLYNAAPKDGTTIGTADQAIPLAQAMGEKLQLDTTKFDYIGNLDVENNTTAAWAASGVKTIQDAEKREVTVGATGGSPSSEYPLAMNAILHTKFKIVLGYPGGADINLAMERGEVAARGSDSWASWKATRPEWLRDHKINILVQIGLKKEPDLPNVPLLMDLAPNPSDRAVLKLLSAPSNVGRPIFAPPGTPADRVAALREAFDATMKDPGFLAAAKTARLEVNPASGAELQKVVDEIAATPKPIAERLAKILAEGDQRPK